MPKLDDLKPGPETDALVAEKVMGWTAPVGGHCGEWRKVHKEEHLGDVRWENAQTGEYLTADEAYAAWWWRKPGGAYTKRVPPFSTSIADAMEGVEKLNWLQFCIERENCSGVRWDISAYNRMDCTDRIHITINEAPYGICLILLKAVGYTNE